jgi:type II secretory pathway component PulF
MDDTGQYFPVLVRELVSVGEQTGHLPEVMKQLVSHYDAQLALRRSFISTIAWPMLQLGAALVAIGFLIWMSAVITRWTDHPTDMLGIGLTGEIGLLIYVAFISAIGVAIFVCWRAAMAGKLWVAPIQRLVLKVPGLGGAFRDLAIARFAWTLQLTMGAALDVKRALELSLKSTHNVQFTDHQKLVHDMIQRGESINETLAATHAFPIELIHAIQVGEESGRLVETMEVVARQQLDSARRAMAVLTKVAGYLVWCVVAAIIISVIFRLFGSYIGQINELARPVHR